MPRLDARRLEVRPLIAEDLPAAASISAAAMGIAVADVAAAARWNERIGHLLGTDPQGTFVATRDDELVGVAQAMRRERLWCLSLLAVRPEIQSIGAGRALLERALEYAVGRGGRVLGLGERGFTVAKPGRGVWLLVARDQPAAAALLWSALAIAGEGERPLVRWITGGQDWAIDICLRAGLRLSAYGALCVRGRPGPLRPFVPSAPFA